MSHGVEAFEAPQHELAFRVFVRYSPYEAGLAVVLHAVGPDGGQISASIYLLAQLDLAHKQLARDCEVD